MKSYRLEVTFNISNVSASRATRVLTRFIDHVFQKAFPVKDSTVDNFEANDFCAFLEYINRSRRHGTWQCVCVRKIRIDKINLRDWPGRMPPISAWCPREAVKKIISFELESKTGVIIVISGRWLVMKSRSGYGSYLVSGSRSACVGRVGHQNISLFQFTAIQLQLIFNSTDADVSITLSRQTATHKLIEPRWMGMYGKFATRSPSGANKAQEKSSLSLIFVLMAVFWRLLPIASATDMKRLENRVRMIGSGPFGYFAPGLLDIDMMG